jgi:large subunit ribosomal protein L11
MAKEISAMVKLQVRGGAANPSPPVGPALGAKGVNIMEFCKLLEASKLKSGSGVPNRNKVGKVTWEQVKAIAEDKMVDLNCFTMDSAMSMVAGTARSMGLTVTGTKPQA